MKYTPNKNLMKSKGLSKDRQVAIQEVGDMMFSVLERPELYADDDFVHRLVESFEYTLQMLWGFYPDSNNHRYWNQVKGCKCPQMDNKELVGSQYKILNQHCPYHGDKHAEDY